jgi:two-component system OmpR family response regulator
VKILVVEDERKVRNFIQEALKAAGMVVDSVEDLTDLGDYLEANEYEAIVLDRMIRGQDSLNLLPEIRKKNPKTKILILSALSEVEDKVRGLSQGADDYLGKPFHVSELVARLHSITRRGETPDSETKGNQLCCKDLLIELDSQKVCRAQKKINLTSKEYKMLTLLAKFQGRVFSKMMLLDQIWDINSFPESNVVEVTIANLRAKIDKGNEPLIHSRRGVGYWLGEP